MSSLSAPKRNTALPLEPSSSCAAVTVMLWTTFQLVASKVSSAGAATRSTSPDSRVIEIITGARGGALSANPQVNEPPSSTAVPLGRVSTTYPCRSLSSFVTVTGSMAMPLYPASSLAAVWVKVATPSTISSSSSAAVTVTVCAVS